MISVHSSPMRAKRCSVLCTVHPIWSTGTRYSHCRNANPFLCSSSPDTSCIPYHKYVISFPRVTWLFSHVSLICPSCHCSSRLASQDLPHGKPHDHLSIPTYPIGIGPLLRPQFCVPTTPCSGGLHNLDSDPMLHASRGQVFLPCYIMLYHFSWNASCFFPTPHMHMHLLPVMLLGRVSDRQLPSSERVFKVKG
jgi:hypothetical protein